MRRCAAVLVVVAVAVGAGSAAAVPPKSCGKVRVGDHRYLAVAHGVSCSFARKWVVRRLRRGHRAAPGFRCRKPRRGSNVKVQCFGRTKPEGDPLYRYYYGIRQ
jgi:hypothetical protein